MIALASVVLWQRKARKDAEKGALLPARRLNTGEITAGIVHEINQPLTAVQTWIRGTASVTARKRPAVSQALAAALTQTQRISALLTRFREHVVKEKVTLRETDLAACWLQVVNLRA